MTNSTLINQLVSTLQGKPAGNGWLCHCPAHDDKNPSLSIRNEGEKILFKCHAGCSQESVIAALKEKNLWTQENPRYLNAIKSEYIYNNSVGDPCLKVTRQDNPNGKKVFFQSHIEKGKWVTGGYQGELAPYFFEKWSKEPDRTVFLVEGEKCVHALLDKSFLATTTPGGAKSWKESFANFFKDREVVILPDNDRPGKDYAEAARKSISSIAKKVKIVNLPDLKEGEDVFDFFKKGHSADELKTIVSGGTTESLAHAVVKTSLKAESEAFYGLAGRVIKKTLPHTESDEMALLIQFLVAFGNVIGRNAFYQVERDKHFMNEFCVIVGRSSKGRKGTSWTQIREGLFLDLEPNWSKCCQKKGLSSGEGLISGVRDPMKKIVKGEEIEIPGVEDKRLTIIETEFASVLRMTERSGNILSTVIRDCWDNGNLQVLTKADPLSASNAHVSIIGHITEFELCRVLSMTEVSNGFGNRFLWLSTARSKKLAHGGNIDSVNFEQEKLDLDKAISFAKSCGQIKMDSETRVIWETVYDELSEGLPGFIGELTSRAEAHVIRLSSIYALLDCSSVIKKEHLQAGLAVWEYCEESVRKIFHSHTGNPISDKIVAACKEQIDGVTKTELHNTVFSRNVSATEINGALDSLVLQKLIIQFEGDDGIRRFKSANSYSS